MTVSYMEQYRKFQQFTNVKEFDQYRSRIFYKLKDKLSKGALSVWNILSQYSCDVPGVCWLKIETIAKAAKVSRSTVERSIRFFKKHGFIRVEETIRRKQGGDGANVYVFLKLDEGAEMKGRIHKETSCESTNPAYISKDETKTLNTKKHYNNHLNNKNNRSYIKFVPKSLQHFKTFLGGNVKILYGRVWLAAKKLGINAGQEIMQEIGFIAMNYIKTLKHLPLEQQCKIAFKIAYTQLIQRLENGDILDYGYEADRFFKSISR